MPLPLTNGPLSIDLVGGTLTINDDGSSLELLDSRGRRDYEPGRYDELIGVRSDGDDYVLLIETNVRGRISYSELSFDGTTGRADRRAESVSKADLVALETLYGTDLDDDGNIGLAEAATEVVRNVADDVALVEVAGAYGIDANLGDDTNAPVILTDSRGRSEWAPGAYDRVIGVREDGTDFVVLVETDVRGRISYSEHRFDATTGQEQGRAVAVDAAALPGLEAAYDADLNGDAVEGYASAGEAIATALGADAALYAAGGGAFAVFNADGTGQPDLLFTSRGDFWTPSVGETVAGLRVDGGDVYLMLEREGAFSEQRFTPGNSLVETGRPVRLEGEALAQAEVLYNIDFDGDTITGTEVVARLDNAADPSIVEGQREAGADNGDVSLFEMTSGAFVVADADVEITPGDPSSALNNPVTLMSGGNSWAPTDGEAIAVRELDGGGYGVIVRAATDSAPVWREQLFDATGESDGFAASLTLRQLVQLERAYDQDFDANGYVTDIVENRLDSTIRNDAGEVALYVSESGSFFVSEDDDKVTPGEASGDLWDEATEVDGGDAAGFASLNSVTLAERAAAAVPDTATFDGSLFLNDRDLFRFEVAEGGATVRVNAPEGEGITLLGNVRVFDDQGSQVGWSDSLYGGDGVDSFVEFYGGNGTGIGTLEAGTYYLGIEGYTEADYSVVLSGEDDTAGQAGFLFNADPETELLESGFNGRPWDISGPESSGTLTNEAIAVRELEEGGYAVITRLSDKGFPDRFYEQSFTADGVSQGFAQIVDPAAVEGFYLQDLNGDRRLDIITLDLDADYAGAVSALALDGETVRMTFEQAQSLTDGEGSGIEGTGTIILTGDVAAGAVLNFDPSLIVEIEAPAGRVIAASESESGTRLEVFDTIQAAIDDSDTTSGTDIYIGDGTYGPVTIDKSGLDFIAGGDAAVIEGAGVNQGAAVRIESGVDETGITGFTINAGAGDLAAVYAVGSNGTLDGFKIDVPGLRMADNTVDGGTGHAFLGGGIGGQGLVDSEFTGNTFRADGPNAVVYVNGQASLGVDSFYTDFEGNTFIGGDNAGLLLGVEGIGSHLDDNVFLGTASYAAVEVWQAGGRIEGNRFDIDGGGAAILVETNQTHSVDDLLADNTFDIPVAGAVREGRKKGIYTELQDAIDAAEGGTTILVSEGTFEESLTLSKAVDFAGAGAGLTVVAPVTGNGLTLSGDLSTSVEYFPGFFETVDAVAIDGISFDGSDGSGIAVADDVMLGSLSISNSSFSGNAYNGLQVGGDYSPVALGSVSITDSTFTGNGEPQASSGDGDILFFQYTGDAVLENVQITGVDRGNGPAENGIQFRSDSGALGDVSLTNVTIAGEYEKTPLAFYNYDDINGLSTSNVTVTATGGWGISGNFDGIGGDIIFLTQDIDVSGSGQPIALQGDGTDNILSGGSDATILSGKQGEDALQAGLGDDILTGGAGADEFAFIGDDIGENTITDFGDGLDKLYVNGLAREALSITETAEGLLITAGAGEFEGSILLEGLKTSYYQDTPPYTQDFEVNASGFFDESDDWYGSVARVESGTDHIISAGGDWHAVFDGDATSAPFSDLGGYSDVFVDGYTVTADIYLDTGWSPGEGFDLSMAASRQDGTHLRDFIFHVTQDTSSGDLIVAGSNNSNFAPREDLDTLANNHVVEESGWHTFEWVFNDDEGLLSVDMNLYEDGGETPVFTETRSDPNDTIADIVGGNRYMWFTDISVAGGIAVDNVDPFDDQVVDPEFIITTLGGSDTVDFGFV